MHFVDSCQLEYVQNMNVLSELYEVMLFHGLVYFIPADHDILPEFNPMPTEEMVQNFNELRQDIVLLYELKLALASCEYDQQMLRHRHDTLNPNSKVSDPLGGVLWNTSVSVCITEFLKRKKT